MSGTQGITLSSNVDKARKYLECLDRRPDGVFDAGEKGIISSIIDEDAIDRNRDAFVAMSTQEKAVVASHDTKKIKFLEDALRAVLERLRDISPSLVQNATATDSGLTYDPDVEKARAFLKDLDVDGNGVVDPKQVEVRIVTDSFTGKEGVLKALIEKQNAIKTDSDPKEVAFYTNALKAIEPRVKDLFNLMSRAGSKDTATQAPTVPAEAKPATQKKQGWLYRLLHREKKEVE